METFLSTVQEPFYLLRRSIQEFHNIRGASKNSIMTGSPLPSSSVITAHKHATRSEAMSNDSSRPMILKPCPRPVHGATKRKRRTGKSHLPPGTVRSFGDFWSTDNFFKKMTPSPSLLWMAPCTAYPPDGDIYNTIIDNGMNADAQILCSISALFLPSYKV